jgi:acetyl-CoA synthetase (ADP-forming)
LKVVSADVIHKSDAGGVILNVKSADEVADDYSKILSNVKISCPKAEISGILVQKMAPSGIEVIVGAVKDPQFGPTVMFGLGGVFVEVMKDVAFRVAPITEVDASEMVSQLKAYPLLNGYRNMPRADISAITDILLNTSKLVMENSDIKELDLNPVIVYERGASTVDARILLE